MPLSDRHPRVVTPSPRPHWLEPLHVPDRVFFVIAIACLLTMLIVELWAWPILPAIIPQHLDARGVVDAYGAKTLWSVFGPTGISILIGLAIAFAYAHPEYANLPTRLDWKKLSNEQQDMIRMALRHLLAMTFLWSTVLICALSLALLTAAFHITSPILTVLIFVLTGLELVTVGGYSVLLQRWVRRLEA